MRSLPATLSGVNTPQPHPLPSTSSFVPPEPRLTDKETKETFSEPPPDLYIPPTQLISDIDSLVTTHIPKQRELNKLMHNIRRKIIHDYNLPLAADKLRILQESDPYWQPIYNFLAYDILPSRAKSARSIRCRAADVFLCNVFLFRLCLHDTKLERSTIQLVIPNNIVDSIISKYHDNLLSNHQGVMRTCLTICRRFYFRHVSKVL